MNGSRDGQSTVVSSLKDMSLNEAKEALKEAPPSIRLWKCATGDALVSHELGESDLIARCPSVGKFPRLPAAFGPRIFLGHRLFASSII
jgi:hypothetical protein